MCRSWFYKFVNPPPRKADQLSLSGHGRHAVQVVNVCWAKNEFQLIFWANLAGFAWTVTYYINQKQGYVIL